MQHVFRPVNLEVCQRGLRHRRPKCSWLELQRAPFTFFKSVFLVTTAHSLKPASKSRCAAHGVQVGYTGASLSPVWLPDPLSRLHDKLSDSLCRMSNPSAQRPTCRGDVSESLHFKCVSTWRSSGCVLYFMATTDGCGRYGDNRPFMFQHLEWGNAADVMIRIVGACVCVCVCITGNSDLNNTELHLRL